MAPAKTKKVVTIKEEDLPKPAEAATVPPVATVEVQKPAAGTAAWLEQKRAKDRARARARPPATDAERERQRIKWHENKQRYNAQRRQRLVEAREAAGLAPPKPGRPAKPPVPPGPKFDINDEDVGEILDNAENIPESVIVVPEDPPRLQQLLGDEIEIPKYVRTFPAFSKKTKPWSELEANSRKGYMASLRKVFSVIAEGPWPKDGDIYALGDYLLEHSINAFDIVAMLTDPARKNSKGEPIGVNDMNGQAAALRALSTALLQRDLKEKKTSGRRWTYTLQMNLIFDKFNLNLMGKASAKHKAQEVSVSAKDNMVAWKTWVTKASAWIKKHSTKKSSFEDKRNALILACYTFIPPTRLQWANVQLADAPQAKNNKINVLVAKPGNIHVYWNKFKNRSAFLPNVPVDHKIVEPKLLALLKPYLAELKSKYLFPKTNSPDSEPLSDAAFGNLIGDIAHSLTGKRFTTQRMRSSFINAWHITHNMGKAPNLTKLRAVMNALLQTNVEVNLSYAKVNSVYDDAIKDLAVPDAGEE